jgi:hypothetical protein
MSLFDFDAPEAYPFADNCYQEKHRINIGDTATGSDYVIIHPTNKPFNVCDNRGVHCYKGNTYTMTALKSCELILSCVDASGKITAIFSSHVHLPLLMSTVVKWQISSGFAFVMWPIHDVCVQISLETYEPIIHTLNAMTKWDVWNQCLIKAAPNHTLLIRCMQTMATTKLVESDECTWLDPHKSCNSSFRVHVPDKQHTKVAFSDIHSCRVIYVCSGRLLMVIRSPRIYGDISSNWLMFALVDYDGHVFRRYVSRDIHYDSDLDNCSLDGSMLVVLIRRKSQIEMLQFSLDLSTETSVHSMPDKTT